MGRARRDNAKAIKRKAKVVRDDALDAGQCYDFTKVALRWPITRLLVLIWAWNGCISISLSVRRNKPNNGTLNILFDVVSVKFHRFIDLPRSTWAETQ